MLFGAACTPGSRRAAARQASSERERAATLSLGPVTITWRQLVGVSYALFALVVPVSYAQELLDGAVAVPEIGLFAAMAVGGLTILLFGFDVARGGEHFRIEPNVETVVGR